MSDTLLQLAEAHGIAPGFHDLSGQYKSASPDTLRALLRAMGVPATQEAEAREALAVVQAQQADRHIPQDLNLTEGQPKRIPAPPCTWTVISEVGTTLASGRSDEGLDLPALPMGYHQLHVDGQGWRAECLLLCRPAPAKPETQPSGWGVCGALYGLRSARNGGLGSYADLGPTCAALAGQGADFLGINPVHALGWAATEMLSPYSPTHRGFFSTDHIAVPGLGPTPDDPLIDYAHFRPMHRAALEHAYADFTGDPAFEAFCAAAPDLSDFATFEALSEIHGEDARSWPADLQTPGKKAQSAAGARARFHAWAQWQAETQMDAAQTAARAAGMRHGLYLDLAVGPRPGSAEVWMNPGTIAQGVSIGAPPDHLNPEGQSWNLAAHAPERLAAHGYQPLRAMLQSLMAKAGILRIDHALGLLRSFWQPEDGSPGGYIRQPFDSLLSVIAIEARRAGCIVIGEDLGLVPDGFRETMNGAGLLSYAVWQFETYDDGVLRPADTLRPFALTCFGTHDTPTINGFWHGRDIAWWRQMGWLSRSETEARLNDRARQRAGLRALCALPPDADMPQIVTAIHDRLLSSPSALVALQLDDLFALSEAQNLPGTVHEHPNWRRRTPVPVETLAKAPQLRDTLPASARRPD